MRVLQPANDINVVAVWCAHRVRISHDFLQESFEDTENHTLTLSLSFLDFRVLPFVFLLVALPFASSSLTSTAF